MRMRCSAPAASVSLSDVTRLHVPARTHRLLSDWTSGPHARRCRSVLLPMYRFAYSLNKWNKRVAVTKPGVKYVGGDNTKNFTRTRLSFNQRRTTHAFGFLVTVVAFTRMTLIHELDPSPVFSCTYKRQKRTRRSGQVFLPLSWRYMLIAYILTDAGKNILQRRYTRVVN